MGLDLNGVKFLLHARRMGVSFERTATIGRQTLLITPKNLSSVLRRFGVACDSEMAERILTAADGYADELFRILGARDVVSFDASGYEGATQVHDFNRPIADEFKNKFSVVLDGGTLEHVFNFPTAIRNCMEMVEVGGHFLGITPTNNHLGHGFYQFSPELFFRVFSKANGFEMEQLAIYEETPDCPWYEVTDPEALRERVILVNDQPTMLLIRAKKTRDTEVWTKPPQQSDYSAAWSASKNGGAQQKAKGFATSSGSAARLARAPISVLKRASIRLKRAAGMLERRRDHFRRFDP